MHWRRYITILLAAALSSGCSGGSGSSGFLTAAAEDQLIETAHAEHRCVEESGFVVCPADETVASAPDFRDPIFPSETVEVSINSLDVTPCTGGTCTALLRFDVSGLPTTAVYQGAQRLSGASGEWVVGSSARANEDSGSVAVELETPLTVEAPLQIAVLVYLEGEPTVPGVITTLQESGADLVFVGR